MLREEIKLAEPDAQVYEARRTRRIVGHLVDATSGQPARFGSRHCPYESIGFSCETRISSIKV